MPQSICYQHWANLWAWTLTFRPPHHSSRVDVPFLCLWLLCIYVCIYVILSQCHTFIMSGNMCCRQEHLWLICNIFQGPFSIYGRTHHNSNIVPWQILRPCTHYYYKNYIILSTANLLKSIYRIISRSKLVSGFRSLNPDMNYGYWL